MEAVFGNAQAEAPVAEEAVHTEAKKQKVKAMKESLKETVMQNPDFKDQLHTLSGSIKVVNTLGFGKGGNILVDKKASTSDNRVLKATSAICGYKLENIGDAPIEYQTKIFSLNEEGEYVGQVVTKQWAPGEQINLSRLYTTILCSRPQISFTLANGKIVASSKKKPKDFEDELSGFYFSFNKNDDGTTIQVNDDEVKLSIDDADGKVKPEYVETFGYLNNPKKSQPKTSKQNFTTQDLFANYIHKMLKDQGIQ